MPILTIKYLAPDMVEMNLDGHKRTLTRETAEKELAFAKAMINDQIVGEAAQLQITYYESAIAYMDATKDEEDDEEE